MSERCPVCVTGTMRPVAFLCDACQYGARPLALAPEPVVSQTPAAVSDETTEALIARLMDEAGITRSALMQLPLEDVLALRAMRFRADHHPDEPAKARARTVARRLNWAPERLRTLFRRYGVSQTPRHHSGDSNGATSDGGG